MSRFPGSYLYVLDGRTPVPCDDVIKWGEWMQTANCRVAETYVGPLHISTVFLGLDHSFHGDGPPALFESMIFGANPRGHYLEGHQERCSTWTGAERMHVRAVEVAEEWVKNALAEGWLEPALTLLRESREDATPPAPSASSGLSKSTD